MSIVSVKNLTHYYGDKLVFKDIDFRLLRSERVGLVGPNGAGKSTLLKILTGMILPDDGTIEWHPNIRVGFLEQHTELLEGLSIRDYLRNAFQHLYKLEEEMLDISRKMETCNEEELTRLLNRFAHIQELLDHHNFYFLDAKMDDIANGLGIQALGMETDVSSLSGGQRTKLLLANLLLKEPDILLLDEPTNYLDVAHIEWLKDYLRNYPNSFILISHDVYFMNEVVNVIYHLENFQLTRYLGDYNKFMETYEFRRQQQLIAYGRQREEIQKLENYIQKNKARASTTKQARSREKKLMKMERIEKPDSTPKPRFYFKVNVRATSKIIETKQLEVGYETPLLPPISVTLKRGDKVAVTGHNGIGKSTMLKTIMGELKPHSGTIEFGQYVKPSYFAQEESMESELTPLEYIWAMHEKMTQKEIRRALAQAGLKKDQVFQPLKSLSGGEQTRVRLCQLMLEDSNWLILDEPTNHLDAVAKEVLANALSQYDGTVLLVSHEPEFFQDWVTDIWNLEEWKGNKS